MDPKTVEKLEEKIEQAIAEVVVKMGLKKLPLLPAQLEQAEQRVRSGVLQLGRSVLRLVGVAGFELGGLRWLEGSGDSKRGSRGIVVLHRRTLNQQNLGKPAFVPNLFAAPRLPTFPRLSARQLLPKKPGGG